MIRWSTRPAGTVAAGATAPAKWAAQHRSHAATRQTAAWRGVDPILRLAPAPGYVVRPLPRTDWPSDRLPRRCSET
eukprot:2538117-Prymnesium_polylepis.1